MFIVPFLICFPFLVSILMFLIRVNKVRNFIAYVSAVVIMGAVAVLVVVWAMNGCQEILLYEDTEVVDHVMSWR